MEDYIVIESINNGEEFTITGGRTTLFARVWDGTIEYSIDGTNWTRWSKTSNGLGGYDWSSVNVTTSKIYLRGKNNSYVQAGHPINNNSDGNLQSVFKITGCMVKIYGKLKCLLDYNKDTIDSTPSSISDSTRLKGLFKECNTIQDASNLSLEGISEYAYFNFMFSGCTNLKYAPNLPTTIPENECYSHMFYECTSLTHAPELPATNLRYGCYRSMFSGCTSLIHAPELPATNLAQDCYRSMFSGCIRLNTIYSAPFNIDDTYTETTEKDGVETTTTYQMYTNNWLLNASNTGNIYFKESIPTCNTRSVSTIPSEWNARIYIKPGNEAANNNIHIYTENKEKDITLTLTSYFPNSNNLFYSLNKPDINTKWIKFSYNDEPNIIFKEVYICGKNNTCIYNGIETFSRTWKTSSTEDIFIDGNIETLLDYSAVSRGEHPPMVSYCFRYLFSGWTKLVKAPKLPATTLTEGCYQHMFEGCTSLTQAPELPATTLAPDCYHSMFYECTSLEHSPELPATTLANYCYQSMFYECTSLEHSPELPATTLANYCYQSMFHGCTSLTQAPELPATTLAEGCYRGILSGCTSLTQAHELPATTLAKGCYQSMFSGCTSLTQAPELPATTLTNYCYVYMFYGCTSLTQSPKLPATTLAPDCYLRMFSGCTSLTQAPELPATTLAKGCYMGMFYECTSLKNVCVYTNKNIFDTKENTSTDYETVYYYTQDWLKNVANKGVFICPPELDTSSRGKDTVPSGWVCLSKTDNSIKSEADKSSKYNKIEFKKYEKKYDTVKDNKKIFGEHVDINDKNYYRCTRETYIPLDILSRGDYTVGYSNKDNSNELYISRKYNNLESLYSVYFKYKYSTNVLSEITEDNSMELSIDEETYNYIRVYHNENSDSIFNYAFGIRDVDVINTDNNIDTIDIEYKSYFDMSNSV